MPFRRHLPVLMVCSVATLGILANERLGRAEGTHLPVRYDAVSFVGPRVGWVLSSHGTTFSVLGTTNAGHSWKRLAVLSLSPTTTPSLQFVDARHGWISAEGAFICGGARASCHTILLRTTDGGVRWRRMYSPAISVDTITFVDSLHGWLIGSGRPCSNVCLLTL